MEQLKMEWNNNINTKIENNLCDNVDITKAIDDISEQNKKHMVDVVATSMENDYVPALVTQVQHSINKERKPDIMSLIQQEYDAYCKIN